MAGKMKHTPAPWTVSIGGAGASIHVNNNFNHPLSFGFNWSPHNDALAIEGAANARLIAAAPDLLAALEEIASTPPGMSLSVDGVNALRAIAQHAVDKATNG